MYRLRALLIIIIFYTTCSLAIVHTVPNDYQTVSEAIIIAAPNDTVLIHPGTYREPLRFRKNITLAGLFLISADTAEIRATIIDATGEPSALELIGTCQPTIVGLTLTGGSRYYGGGIYLRSHADPFIRNCVISGNASGIYCNEECHPEVIDCTIINNRGEIGGDGINCRAQSAPVVSNCLIALNSGAGIFCREESNPTISNCQILENQSKGIYLSGSRPVITDCLISENTDQVVGGIYCHQGSHATITNCTIIANEGEAFGGLGTYNSNPRVVDCEIRDNIGGSVGGIRLALNSQAEFIRTRITGNIGRGQWGGIRCDESNPAFLDCYISGNVSQQGCSGVSLSNSAPRFERCVIADHLSPDVGGALHCIQSNPTFVQCTITRNISAEVGGAFYIEGGCRVSCTNTIIWNNSRPLIHLYSWGRLEDEIARLDFNHCDVHLGRNSITTRGVVDTTWSKFLLIADPLFLDPQGGDFHLSPDSPCIDRGTTEMGSDPDWTVPDLGAHFVPQPNISLRPREAVLRNATVGTRDSLTVRIQNIGLRPLAVDSLFLVSGTDYLTMQTDATSFTLAENAVHTVKVWYEPLTYGNHRAVIIVRSNDRDLPRGVIFLTGMALEAPTENNPTPGRFRILTACPNPFNSYTTVRFSLPVADFISLRIYNCQGQLLQQTPPRFYPSGLMSLNPDFTDYNSGLYFIELTGTRDRDLCRVVLTK